MAEATAVKPKTRQVEVPVVICDYCGHEEIQLNQVSGQSGETRHICGDCFIAVFDKILGKKEPGVVPVEKPVAEPIAN